MLEWYLFISKLNITLSEPIKLLNEQFNIPLLTALLLGLLGSTSPCQLTTNASAVAFISQKLRDVKGAWKTVLAYTPGKVMVYTGGGGEAHVSVPPSQPFPTKGEGDVMDSVYKETI